MSLPTAKTILVVEDEPILLKFVRTILERAGYSVVAASPKEAIRISEDSEETIDLLLTGLSMLPVSGPKVATILKSRKPTLHVMLMSSDPDAPLLARDNHWSFTAKPFEISDLLNRIRNVFSFDVPMSLGRVQ